MKPPVCAVCETPFDPATGGTVSFLDYTPIPENMSGHPHGMEWFCQMHLEKARQMQNLDAKTAVTMLKSLNQTG